MKTPSILMVFALLSGCSMDTRADSDVNKEYSVFGKISTQTYVIASPMDGVLLKNGKPLANTKIVRRLWRNVNEDELLEQEFVTDAEGRFSLPIYEEQLSLGRLAQFACTTKLEAEVNGQHVDVWFSDKFKPEVYAETEGHRLAQLVCDIENEEVSVEAGVSTINTICRWSEMPDHSQD